MERIAIQENERLERLELLRMYIVSYSSFKKNQSCDKNITNSISDQHQEAFFFLKYRCSAVSILIEQISIKSDRGIVLGISFDLKVAYDSVYIDELIMKSAQLGISGRMFLWLHRFLAGRIIKVLWRGLLSSGQMGASRCYSQLYSLYNFLS